MMMWLHRTPEWFEQERNPGNGCIRLLENCTFLRVPTFFLINSTDADKGYVFDGFDEFRRAKRSAPEPTVTVNQSLDLDDSGEKKEVK